MTWACKKNSNSTYIGQLNARGFEQITGKHFNSTSTAAPVTSNTIIRIVLVLLLLADWMARIYDMKGVSLEEKFEDGKVIFIKVPQGMEHHYWDLAVLKLLKPLYR